MGSFGGGGRRGKPRAAVPYPSRVPFLPSPTRRTAAVQGLRCEGATAALRLPPGWFFLLAEPEGVPHRVISPSLRSVKLPVAGCWR